MKILFDSANEYLEQSDWKDIALVKLCLCAIGVMIGMEIGSKVSKEKQKLPFLIAGIVFVVTYIPLMKKFLKVLIGHLKK